MTQESVSRPKLMRITASPVPRTWIDDVLPAARMLLGLLFVVYSSAATIMLMAQDLNALATFIKETFASDILILFTNLSYGRIAGMVGASGFFVGEILTAEYHPRAYFTILTPDAIYTARMTYPVVLAIALMSPAGGIMIIAGSIWLFTMTSGMPLIPSIILTVVGGSVAAGLLFLLPVTTAAVSVVGALGIGYTVARSGEELILGKRRRYV